MTDHLFDLPAVEPLDRTRLSSDRRRTLRRKDLIAQGVHPLTRVPLLGSHQCRECVHAYKSPGGFWKCDRVEVTHGPGTDLIVSWPACTEFESGPRRPA